MPESQMRVALRVRVAQTAEERKNDTPSVTVGARSSGLARIGGG